MRTLKEFLSDVRHNRAIERKWQKDGCPIVQTTVGWRPDPIDREDGYKDNGDGSFSKLVRGGTEEYRQQFSNDVENSRGHE